MKKIILLSIAILLAFICFAHSQTTIMADRIIMTDRIINEYEEMLQKIVVDTDGSYYVSGYFDSPTITFNNGKSLTQIGSQSGFVAKYNSNGECQWAEKITGDSRDNVSNIALGTDGTIYVVGNFSSSTLYFNNNIELHSSGNNMYVARYNSNGECLWAKGIFSTGEYDDMLLFGIAIDDNNNLYVSGAYTADDGIIFSESITLERLVYIDSFIAKYNSNGECQWANQIPFGFLNIITSIAVDANYNIYFTGVSYYGEFYFDEYNYVSIDSDVGFAYLGKFNSDMEYQWGRLLNPDDELTMVFQVALDSKGDVYIAANTSTEEDVIELGEEQFIAKYSSSGDIQWKELISGDNSQSGSTMIVSPSDDIYIGGYFTSSTLYFNNGITLENSDGVGYSYGYFAKYNSNGKCKWAEKIIGEGDNSVMSIAVDGERNIYVTGYYSSDELLFNNNYSLELGNVKDLFIAKYEPPFVALPILSETRKTSGVTFWNAVSGGEVLDEGGDEVTERGVCISKNRYPDINDIRFVADEAGIGAFTVNLSNLQSSTKYYVRVYAINDGGVAYGKERTFTTPPLPPGTY